MKRRDLAIQYFPDKKPVDAVRMLHRWIANCPQLVSELTALNKGYAHKQELTLRQVRIIKHYLGDP